MFVGVVVLVLVVNMIGVFVDLLGFFDLCNFVGGVLDDISSVEEGVIFFEGIIFAKDTFAEDIIVARCGVIENLCVEDGRVVVVEYVFVLVENIFGVEYVGNICGFVEDICVVDFFGFDIVAGVNSSVDSDITLPSISTSPLNSKLVK